MKPPVLVSLVTWNDEAFLETCLESVFSQTVPVRVKVFDNASTDSTCRIARRFDLRLETSESNRGYSHGHNRNLAGERFDFTLLLNADVILHRDYLERLLEALEAIPEAGLAGGKIYRMDSGGNCLRRNGSPVLDSTGIYFTPALRHFDRGGGEEDRGQYERRQLVFGTTGAVLLCRKKLLDEVRFGDEILDEDFFAYREDADLAWRAQLLGWKALYEPRAVALHHRHVLPERRRQLASLINYHSLKNRYLLRMKNLDRAVSRKCFPFMWFRDFGILLYVLLSERTSLPAYGSAWRLRRRFREKRKHLQDLRRVPPREIACWFSFEPAAFDVNP